MTSPLRAPSRPRRPRGPRGPALVLSLALGLVLGLLGGAVAASPASATTPVPGPGELVVTITGPGGAPVDGFLGLYQWDPDQDGFIHLEDIPLAGPSPHSSVMRVDEGSYFLYFDDAASGGAGYSGASEWSPWSPGDPGVVTVTREQGASTTITVEPPTSVVTGRVVDQQGAPTAATITADGDPLDETATEADGTFVLDLIPGPHSLEVVPDDDELASRTLSVTVDQAPEVDLGDLVLAPVSRWTVTGTVTDQWGRPLAARVSVSRATADGSYAAVPPADGGGDRDATADGGFGWDLRPGTHRVSATLAGCTAATSDALVADGTPADVPLVLTCTGAGPAPTVVPQVSGTPRVGSTLTAVDATWAAPLASTGLRLVRDGVALPGTDHVLTVADVGAVFTVAATARRTGFQTVVATSRPVVGQLGAAPVAVRAPRVTGAPRTGSVLTATAGTWRDAGTAALAYRWTRDGVPIPGADRASYRVTTADAARRIAVVVTATRPGYAAGSATSAAVRVARLTSTTTARLAKATVRARRTATLRMAVAAPGGAPTGSVRVLVGSRVLATATLQRGAATVKVRGLRAGRHRLTVVYAGSATVETSRSRVVVLRVRR